jgi:hypothetical protein
MKDFKTRSSLEKQLFTETALKASIRMLKVLRELVKSAKKENKDLKFEIKRVQKILETKNKKIRLLKQDVNNAKQLKRA